MKIMLTSRNGSAGRKVPSVKFEDSLPFSEHLANVSLYDDDYYYFKHFNKGM